MANLGYLNVKDYGAKGDGSTDDTNAIQQAFDDANTLSAGGESVTVFLPAGEYIVGVISGTPLTESAVKFEATGCKLTGGGTLKHKVGCNSREVLRITGERNLIERIRVDCNVSEGANVQTRGYRVDGKSNLSTSIVVLDSGGSSIIHFGIANRMKRCISLGGYEGLRDGGDLNIMSYCVALDYLGKGYNNAAESNWTSVIGCHTESSTDDGTGASYQIDSDPDFFGRATFRDCTCQPAHNTGTTTNGGKFTWIKDVYLDGCQFIHTLTTITTLRLAGSALRSRVKDTFLSRDLHVQRNFGEFGVPPETIQVERSLIGDGTHAPTYSIEQVRCNALLLRDSTFLRYSTAGIEWWAAEGTYSLISAVNCAFAGKKDGGVTYDIDAVSGEGGQINRSRRTLWLGNLRLNSGTGSQSDFTDGSSNDLLGTTRDASMSLFQESTTPTGTAVTWTLGDAIANTSPTAGGYYGWVCTSAGPPAVWKQFAQIAL